MKVSIRRFAIHLEGHAVEREALGGSVDFGSLVVMLDCDRESLRFSGFLGLFRANSVQVTSESSISAMKMAPQARAKTELAGTSLLRSQSPFLDGEQSHIYSVARLYKIFVYV